MYIYLVAEVYILTVWQAPSQTASGIWHLFKYCELPCVLKNGVPSHKLCSNTLGRRFMDALKSDFCNKNGKHIRGTQHNIRGLDLHVRGFGGCISESIGIWHPSFSCGYPCLNGVIVSLESIVLSYYSQIDERGMTDKINSRRWWTLNLASNQTSVHKFGCRDLHFNRLTGPIPNTIGNLPSLQTLWAPLCVKNWSIPLTSYVRTPLREDSWMLWNQIFATKMVNILWAQTSMWGDSEAAFPRASE